ncbi:MAG: RNA methyltransferase [Planctomycetes bacterium]|nr:RNA methyltransferase [Planctomycetota bacterium]
MTLAAVLERAKELGANERQRSRLARAWLSGGELATVAATMREKLSRRVLAALPEFELDLARAARVASIHPGADDATRLLIELADGATVETVLLPRNALCVSSQIGCAVGCRFCKTGEGGLARNLEVDEILVQVVLARRVRAVDRVVFMGMGEPAHNLGNVLATIERLGQDGEFAHKRLVFSTVGDGRVFERLNEARVRPALALSLHSADDAKRAELLPRAPRVPVRELVELADAYARAVTWPVLYQWTLLDGVNDSDADLEGAIELLSGRRGILNVIGWNAVEGFPFRRTPRERAIAWVRALKRAGVLATLRDSAGQDVDGGCGQLRSRRLAETAG